MYLYDRYVTLRLPRRGVAPKREDQPTPTAELAHTFGLLSDLSVTGIFDGTVLTASLAPQGL